MPDPTSIDEPVATPGNSGQQQQKQPPKNPIEAATAKLKEAMAKELNQKVEQQQKKTMEAFKVFMTEKNELLRLVKDAEYSKKDMETFLDAIKE